MLWSSERADGTFASEPSWIGWSRLAQDDQPDEGACWSPVVSANSGRWVATGYQLREGNELLQVGRSRRRGSYGGVRSPRPLRRRQGARAMPVMTGTP